jgi:molybdopterin/thiamine biosynthesis adenylyltransferase
MKAAVKEAVEIPDFAGDRYSALKLIPWWQHDKIRGAKIMVVGAGALGNEALKNLALLGIGHIFIVDLDDIETSNLSRSVLFRSGDSGKSKAELAALRLKEVNPDISVAFHRGNVITDIGLGIFRRMDLVIGCVDNIEARLFINEACWSLNKPWINGGIEAMQGVVDVFVPPDGPCYECTMSDLDYAEMNRRQPCGLPPEQLNEGKIPTTPTIASIIAGVMVQEAMKLIHGKGVQSGTGWLPVFT